MGFSCLFLEEEEDVWDAEVVEIMPMAESALQERYPIRKNVGFFFWEIKVKNEFSMLFIDWIGMKERILQEVQDFDTWRWWGGGSYRGKFLCGTLWF